jgi:hypothetical protein
VQLVAVVVEPVHAPWEHVPVTQAQLSPHWQSDPQVST